MHSADVRITHLESPEIQYLLIGYLLMIALFLPLPLSLSLFASLSSTNIISIKKNKILQSILCEARASAGACVSCRCPGKEKKRKKLIHLRFPPMAAPKKDRSGREIVIKSAAACCFSNVPYDD